MNFYDAQYQLSALAQRLSAHDGWVITCYCAAWCDTCRAYRSGFEDMARRMPQHVFVWVDIEEVEALLDDEDIENFPTLLVQSDKGNVFFGPMLPQPEHLLRLLQGAANGQDTISEGPRPIRELVAAAAQ